ncbi:hypothetical protein [Tautonia plasticadhaerens]|uniref:Peptidase family M50 n=1 Tax=Tautonia plasticadhaerens TaxID=2527974 RepID=A0A518H5L6_9BACT|nr:hypothetical protein [Tautonia plasticadhaerens]QDV36129.1 hypothetical protein ElP_40430 [Tautonia plasticadhaerens]
MSNASNPPLPPLPGPGAPADAGPGAPRGRSTASGVLVFLVMVGCGMVVGGLIGRASKSSTADLDRVQGIAAIAGILVALPMVLVLHELGHVVGGLAAGFRFNLFVVGPLKVVREADRIRARLNTNLSIAGGLAGCSPTGSGDHRRGMILMVAAGPIASLLGAAAGLLGAGATGGFAPGASGWSAASGMVLGAFGLGSLAIGLLTLVPGRTGNFMTDGARLIGLLRKGPEADREAAVIGLVAESASGIRPRDWDPGLVSRAVSVPDGSLLDAVAEQLAYSWALDRGDLTLARDHLARSLSLADRLPPSVRPAIELEAAAFEAAIRADAAACRRWLDRAGVPGGLVPRHLRPTAEAALAVAEGRFEDAPTHIEAARDALSRTSDPGSIPVARDRLDDLSRRCRPMDPPAHPEPKVAGSF